MKLADLLQEAPDPTGGEVIPGLYLGDSEFQQLLTARLYVRALLPEYESSIYGQAIYGTHRYSPLAWHDLTSHVRGAQYRRGGEAGGRPETGELVLTLDSTNDLFNPLADIEDAFGEAPTFFGAGTWLSVWVRFFTYNNPLYPAGTYPLFTGRVRSWLPRRIGLGANEFVDISVMEPTGSLAQHDELEQPSVGAYDTMMNRVSRLLEDAKWRAGLAIMPNSSYIPAIGFQPTTLAQNRLSELYLTVDSVDFVFRTHPTGAAVLHPRGYIGTNASVTINDYDPDSLEIANDEEALTNSVTLGLARAEDLGTGFPATWSDSVSIGRRGRKSWGRTDLITQTAAHHADMAAGILARSGNVLRPVSFNSYTGKLLGLDIGTRVAIQVVEGWFHHYAVCSIARSFDATTGHFTSTFGVEPTEDSYFEAT